VKICGDIRGSRCTTGVNDTGGKWKKSSSRKILILLFGHLWVVELTYIYIFAFKFTLRCLQPNIVIIICHRCQQHRRKFGAGVVDAGGNLPPASLTPVANLPPVLLTPVVNLPPVSTAQGKLVAKFAAGVLDTGGKFAAGPNGTLWGWGETDS
jgi:hypothetical protein